jgi:cytochrome c553
MRVTLLVFLITLGGFTLANDARIDAIPPDQRLLLALDDDERNFLLHEMRGLLSATQSILDATLTDDRQRVIESARAAGIGPQGPAQHIPPGLRVKLPEAFRKLGLGTHQAFDEIASDAEAGASRDALQRKLAAAMQRCVACHAAYGLRSSR